MPSCPNCNRVFDQRGLRNHIATCKTTNGGDTYGVMRSLMGTPVEIITTLVVGVISIVLVVIVARYIFVPFFATFDKVYTLLSSGADVVSYIL